MTKIQNFKIFFAIIFTLSFLLFQAREASATELFLEAKSQKIVSGEQFVVNTLLNTPLESINAVEAKISFPKALLELKEIRDGNSIVSFWIGRPKAVGADTIGFSGIIPGGYQETKGFLFSIVFQTKANGNGAIEIRDAKVLLNDGKGTPASLKISPFQFSISQKGLAVQPTAEPVNPVRSETSNGVKDIEPPEKFKPEIAQSKEIFDGKYFLVFATQDKGSGIDHYEIKELFLGLKGAWNRGESPYQLLDQNLLSIIEVRAVDKVGRERTEKFVPSRVVYVLVVALVLLALAIIGFVYILLRRVIKKYKFGGI